MTIKFFIFRNHFFRINKINNSLTCNWLFRALTLEPLFNNVAGTWHATLLKRESNTSVFAKTLRTF